MKCPNDNTALVMTERSGVEIDYCPECRGVWLDRGELDKILERSAAMTPPPQQQQQPYGGHGYNQGHGTSQRRDSWLGQIFG